MATSALHVPAFVNYECELCGWCCRQYDITFSAAECERLSSYAWGELAPALAGRELWAPLRDRRSPDQYRLRYVPGGGCVFLSSENTCLMHRHVGMLGKPLGCCVFPFTFAAAPDGVYVGCRFSCPAMAYGRGKPVVHREDALREQLELVERSGHLPRYPEEVVFAGSRTLPWHDYMKLERVLVRVLLRDDVPMPRRLFMIHKFIEVLRAASLENVSGRGFSEMVKVLEEGLWREAREEELPRSPGGLWRVMFRQFCFLFQRREGGAYRELSLGGKIKARLGNLGRAIEFVFAAGAPALSEFPGRFRLADVGRLAPRPLDARAEQALSRFMAAKVFGKQYFGKLFFGYPLIDGLVFLLLSAGAIMWYARARALARGAEAAGTEDVIEAIRYVDYCYGFSAAPGLIVERLRTKVLARGDTAARVALAQFG